MWVRIGFESPSEVSSYARPRGGRVWDGSIRVRGGRIDTVTAPGLENRFHEDAARTWSRGAEFLVITRGRMDAVGLELDGVKEDTELEIRVAEGTSGFEGVETPAIDESITVGDAVDGPVVRRFEVVDPVTGTVSIDSITVQVFDPSDSLDQSFEFSDLGPARPGDYYYLRVTQIDGGRAWSSPWWVGDRDPAPPRVPVSGRASGSRTRN
jgi:hypothetical protein